MKVGDTIVIRGVVTKIHPKGPFNSQVIVFHYEGKPDHKSAIRDDFISEVIPTPWVPKVGDKYRIGESMWTHEIVAMTDEWYIIQTLQHGNKTPFVVGRNSSFTDGRTLIEE